MKVHYFTLIFVIILFSNCRKDDVSPRSSWFTFATDSLIKTLPTNLSLLKPALLISDTVATRSHVLKFAIQRAGTSNTPTISTLTGTLFKDIPLDVINVFTRGNKPLAEAGLSNATVSGWNINGINFLDTKGLVTDINKNIDLSTAEALSIIITFYPDGYYTFINNKNQLLNEMGWYQLSIVNGLPIGFIYSALHSGADFKSNPRFESPMQSFGVWGINETKFFPLIQINRTQAVFLNMVPINY